jgi:RHS repeat-associated protein
MEETIYFDGVELKRKRNSSGDLTYSQWNHHVTDTAQRIAIINHCTLNTQTAGGKRLADGDIRTRYQYGNHLGSTSLELDDAGEFVSYQEYYPYGTVSYIEGDVSSEYRFTGKERDELTGLYYYGARYYASWLGRWISADPSGPVDGLNLFAYVRGNPVTLVDPDGRESRSGWVNPVRDRRDNEAGGGDEVTTMVFEPLESGGGNFSTLVGDVMYFESEDYGIESRHFGGVVAVGEEAISALTDVITGLHSERDSSYLGKERWRRLNVLIDSHHKHYVHLTTQEKLDARHDDKGRQGNAGSGFMVAIEGGGSRTFNTSESTILHELTGHSYQFEMTVQELGWTAGDWAKNMGSGNSFANGDPFRLRMESDAFWIAGKLDRFDPGNYGFKTVGVVNNGDMIFRMESWTIDTEEKNADLKTLYPVLLGGSR